MKHPQIHSTGRFVSSVHIVEYEGRSYSSEIAIDRYFSQEQNLRNGCVDTSPNAVSTPQGAAHCQPSSPERPLPNDFTTDDIHDMVISKRCQSLYETSQLGKLKPSKEYFVENEPEQPSAEPSVEPSNS